MHEDQQSVVQYIPLPIGFEGMIRQNQSSDLLQIFPIIHLVVNLIDHAEITPSTSSGVYNTSGFVMINCRRLEYYYYKWILLFQA